MRKESRAIDLFWITVAIVSFTASLQLWTVAGFILSDRSPWGSGILELAGLNNGREPFLLLLAFFYLSSCYNSVHAQLNLDHAHFISCNFFLSVWYHQRNE